MLGERWKYARGAEIGQGVALLPVVYAGGANLICASAGAGAVASPLVPIMSLNSITLTSEPITAIAPIGAKLITQGLALLVLDGGQPFQFAVNPVDGESIFHVVGWLR